MYADVMQWFQSLDNSNKIALFVGLGSIVFGILSATLGGLFGSLLAFWLARDQQKADMRGIEFSWLHIERAKIIASLYALLVEMSDVLQDKSSANRMAHAENAVESPEELKIRKEKASKLAQMLEIKIVDMIGRNNIYFPEPIVENLNKLRVQFIHVSMLDLFSDSKSGAASYEKMRKDIEATISLLYTEFKKLLGV